MTAIEHPTTNELRTKMAELKEPNTYELVLILERLENIRGDISDMGNQIYTITERTIGVQPYEVDTSLSEIATEVPLIQRIHRECDDINTGLGAIRHTIESLDRL